MAAGQPECQEECGGLRLVGVKNTFLEFQPKVQPEALRRRARSADSPLARFGVAFASPFAGQDRDEADAFHCDKGVVDDSATAETSSQVSHRSMERLCSSSSASSTGEAPDDEVDETKPTTAMIKGIVCSLQEYHVVRILGRAGFGGSFDSVRLPTNSTTGNNLGYCFVNFVSHEEYLRCVQVFDDQSFGPARSRKRRCQVFPAHIQGTLESSSSLDD